MTKALRSNAIHEPDSKIPFRRSIQSSIFSCLTMKQKAQFDQSDVAARTIQINLCILDSTLTVSKGRSVVLLLALCTNLCHVQLITLHIIPTNDRQKARSPIIPPSHRHSTLSYLSDATFPCHRNLKQNGIAALHDSCSLRRYNLCGTSRRHLLLNCLVKRLQTSETGRACSGIHAETADKLQPGTRPYSRY